MYVMYVMYVCMYVSMYVCMYVYNLYIYLYINSFTSKGNLWVLEANNSATKKPQLDPPAPIRGSEINLWVFNHLLVGKLT